ncbi:hypothetical protein ACHAWF_018544 [Thalassiosira exigua]
MGPVFHFSSERGQLYLLVHDDKRKELPNWSATRGRRRRRYDDYEWSKRQEPILVQLLAPDLDVDVADIIDFELNLFDVQKAELGGARDEFLHSARLDSFWASCYLSLWGLIEHVKNGGVEHARLGRVDGRDV